MNVSHQDNMPTRPIARAHAERYDEAREYGLVCSVSQVDLSGSLSPSYQPCDDKPIVCLEGSSNDSPRIESRKHGNAGYSDAEHVCDDDLRSSVIFNVLLHIFHLGRSRHMRHVQESSKNSWASDMKVYKRSDLCI